MANQTDTAKHPEKSKPKGQDIASPARRGKKLAADSKKSVKQITSGTDLVKDGGKWAGSGRKVVEHGKGPEVAAQSQSQTGRGALRTTLRQPKPKQQS